MKLQTLFEMSSRPCKINRTGDPVRAAAAQEIPRGQFILQGRELIFLDTASFAQRIAFLFCSGTNALLYFLHLQPSFTSAAALVDTLSIISWAGSHIG